MSEKLPPLISEFNLRKYRNEGNNLVDGTEFLANVKQQVISFFFEPTEEYVYFKAFITTFSDTYTPNYNTSQVFGRTDPIHIYQNTSRDISLAFDIPAASESEAFENLGRVQKLIHMLYPGYLDISGDGSNALTLAEAPLVRLKVMNLLSKHEDSGTSEPPPEEAESFSQYFTKYNSSHEPSKGTLGVIKSCTFQHNLENPEHGVFAKGPNTILPKTISVNISFTPFHEKTVGRRMETVVKKENNAEELKNASSISKTFPYGVDLGPTGPSNIKEAGLSRTKVEELKKTAEEARRQAAAAQQKLEKKEAKYVRAFEKFSAAQSDPSTSDRRLDRLERRKDRAGNALDSDEYARASAVSDLYTTAAGAEQDYQDYIK
jgi:hypothetical protein